MLSRFRYIVSLAVVLCSALRTVAQFPVADQVCTGTSKSYWVDTTPNSGFTYIWAINGIIMQNSNTCLFNQVWSTEGTYDLTVWQVSSKGCSGNRQTIPVIVRSKESTVRVFPNPIFGPDISFQVSVAESSVVSIDLFSLYGQLICRIFEGFMSGGITKTITCHHRLSQGVYPYQIRAGRQIFSGRLIILREY